MIVKDSGITDDSAVAPADDSEQLHVAREPVREQQKFPRWVRLALMLIAPIVLWTGIYLLARALL